MAFWKRSSRSKELTDMHRQVSDIGGLPLSEVKPRALAALEDPARFECVRASPAGELPAALPASAREVFALYSSIRAVSGDAVLSRDQIGPAEYRSGFLRLGTNLGSTEVVVRPGEEPVYEVDGSDADEQEIQKGGAPSLYHWILITDEVLYGNRNQA